MVKGNATANDYVKVEDLLNDIGPLYQIDDVFAKIQVELVTFQSPDQTNYTMAFYESLKSSFKTSKAAIVSNTIYQYMHFLLYLANMLCFIFFNFRMICSLKQI